MAGWRVEGDVNRSTQAVSKSRASVRVRYARARAHGFEAQVALSDGAVLDLWVPRNVVDSIRTNLFGYADLVASVDGRPLPAEAAAQVIALLCARSEACLDGELEDFDDLTERPTERYSDVPTGTIDPPGSILEVGGSDVPAHSSKSRGWVLAVVGCSAFTAGLVVAALFGQLHVAR